MAVHYILEKYLSSVRPTRCSNQSLQHQHCTRKQVISVNHSRRPYYTNLFTHQNSHKSGHHLCLKYFLVVFSHVVSYNTKETRTTKTQHLAVMGTCFIFEIPVYVPGIQFVSTLFDLSYFIILISQLGIMKEISWEVFTTNTTRMMTSNTSIQGNIRWRLQGNCRPGNQSQPKFGSN